MTRNEAIAELVRIWHSPHLDLSLKAGLAEAIETLKADTVQGAYLINKHDAITVIRDECWKCNKMINDDLCMRILALPDSEQTDCTEFIEWLVEVIMDDEDWELNAVAYGEIIARKMKKLGLLEVKDGYYIRPSAEARPTGEWTQLYDSTWVCSNCEKAEQFGENIESTSDFCPNCGAYMIARRRETDGKKKNTV